MHDLQSPYILSTRRKYCLREPAALGQKIMRSSQKVEKLVRGFAEGKSNTVVTKLLPRARSRWVKPQEPTTDMKEMNAPFKQVFKNC